MTELTWQPFQLFPEGTIAQSPVEPWWFRLFEYGDITYTMLYEQKPPLGHSVDGRSFPSLAEAQEYLAGLGHDELTAWWNT